MSETAQRWADVLVAATLIAVDPVGLRGARVIARPGPARTAWLAHLEALIAGPVRRAPCSIDDEGLLGGADLAATLRTGRLVARRGLLAQANGGLVVAAMAERLTRHAAALIAAALDSGRVRTAREGLDVEVDAAFALIALDEGVAPEEAAPAALCERLAFTLTLDAIPAREAQAQDLDAVRAQVGAARGRLADVAPPDDAAVAAMTGVAAAFGIASLRAPAFALRAARAAAALRGASAIDEDDLALAARLTLAPRATVMPSEEDAPPPDDPHTEEDRQERDADCDQPDPDSLGDRIIAAVRAAAPENLIAAIAANAAAGRNGGGGEGRAGPRGRPAGVRPGRPGGALRVDLGATLRAAAPWQTVRRRERPAGRARIDVRLEDVRLKRRIERSEQTVIFLVDASGSAALHRLAECKGAVELLLAQAYVSRTRAALIAFRKTGAETLLAPTRSLARAKRALADLPGGGGTPIAAGLDAALRMALQERSQARAASVVVMTDGRANVTRAGRGGRAEAEAEALAAAQAFRVFAVDAALIDAAPRASESARALADAMGARYIPLPFAGAVALVGAISPP